MERFTFFSKILRQGTAIVTEKCQSLTSHKLLLLSGILSPSSPGVFVFSPIALRVIDKLTAFMDHKMSIVGGQKCLFPTLGRSQLWEKSGRWERFGGEIFRLKDRADRSFCLQPTHEEEACAFLSGFSLINDAFPLRLYQISSKFRDEIQPKLGLIRCREFLMKDMYSFDLDVESAKQSYEVLSDTYTDIFSALRLPVFKVSAEGGLMGGCFSEEFHCPLPVGEDTLSVCQNCNKAVLVGQTDSSLCPDCGSYRQTCKSVELAHCFLLGDSYTSTFGARVATPNGDKILKMGCYGIGVTRLLAVALEHFTTTMTKKDPPTELRWPLGFAPFSGAIALQKSSANDALPTDELNRLLAHFGEHPRPSTGSESDPKFFAGLLSRGDILVDDRPHLSLGRKLFDLRQLGVPWILIAKSHKCNYDAPYELIDVNRGLSFAANLDEALAAFTHFDFRIPIDKNEDQCSNKLWRRSDSVKQTTDNLK